MRGKLLLICLFVYKHVFTMDKHIKNLYFIKNFHRRLRMCQDKHKVPRYDNKRDIIPSRIHRGKTDAETDYNTRLRFNQRYVLAENLVPKFVKHCSSPKNLTVVMGTKRKFVSTSKQNSILISVKLVIHGN